MRSLPILSGMVVAATLLAGLLTLVGWLAHRRRRATGRRRGSSAALVIERTVSATNHPGDGLTQAASGSAQLGSAQPGSAQVGLALGGTAVEIAADLASQRLWRLAFGAPARLDASADASRQ